MPSVAGRVLIAEDNAALSAVIEFTVQRAGFETVVAGNGEAALRTALGERFDIVMSDQQMPRMTGLEFLRELRRHEAYAATPLILLTAKRLELDVDRLKSELGLAEVFAKPFSPNRLAALLRELSVGVS